MNVKAKDILKSMDVRPRKEKGQNFVISPWVIEEILKFAEIPSGSNIVEIGPGLGALTRELVKLGEVTAIEIEDEFCVRLKEELPQVKIINADARSFDFSTFPKGTIVIGNLPYVYSTDILFHMLGFGKNLSRAIFLLQKEFTERISSPPGFKAYGIPSVLAQAFCVARKGPIIPGNVFHPPTQVESRVLELKYRAEPTVPPEEYVWFAKIVRGSFLKKRKMIHNSLKSSGLLTAEKIDLGLEKAGIEPTRRAETLTVEEFLHLAIKFRELRDS